MIRKILIPLVLLAAAEPTVYAYELGTHGALTHEVYKRSVLADSEFLKQLGVENGVNPFGPIYYDISATETRERTRQPFEEDQAARRMPPGTEPLSIEGWLMRGAIREDDSSTEDNPQDDPYHTDLKRPLHHFFDPYNNRPLTAFGLSLLDPDVHTTPAWGLGTRDPFAQPNAAEVGRRNHFTVFDAREAMYRALTGRDSQGNVLQPAAGGTLTRPQDIRSAYWATMFRALGDVVHLVQDTGQPQHTRNDRHAGRLGAGETSVYEKYIDARARAETGYKIDGRTEMWPPLNYGSYPVPAFARYSDYFSTNPGTGSLGGRGLADYSNRGFFSAGTNLGSNSYVSPSNDAANYAKESATGLLSAKPLQKLNFLLGDVSDTFDAGSSEIIRMTTESVFDLFLATTPPTYSLNRFNYDGMAGLLIPRAVAYSAGLINHFFRGRIDLVPDPNSAGQHLIRNVGSEPMKGKFRLYYDDQDGNRNQVLDAGGQALVWDTEVILAAAEGVLAAGASLPVPGFVPPSSPPPRTPGEYMLVFSGDMGEEKAEAGGVGAVVGKQIRNEYKGALYIVGVDANGVITSVRADKDGTEVLNGWDISKRDANNPNGVFIPPSVNVFDPLGSLYRGSATKSVQDKIYAYKQAEYGPGPIEYETKSVTLISPDNPNAMRSHYGQGFAQVSFGEVVWVARSPDEQIGSFEFRLTNISFTGQDAGIAFTRRFRDATGASRTQAGFLQLPTLPNSFSYQQSNGKLGPGNSSFPLVVSDDGLTIRGFATTGPNNSRVHMRIVIELAQTPRFSLEQTIFPTTTSGLGFFPDPPYQPAEPCSVDFRRIPDGMPTTVTSNGFVRSGTNEFESSLKEEVPFGNLAGRMLTYVRESAVKRTDIVDESICYAEGTDFDPATGLQRRKYSIRNTASNDVQNTGGTFERFVGGDYSVPTSNTPTGSTFMTQLKSEYPGGLFLCRVCQWGQIYDGFDPVPSIQVIQKGAPFRRNAVGRNVVRPLTDRHADVIYGESASDTQPFVRMFRGIALSGKEYVADSSPLGEVFFAVSDKSVVIHEPVPGGMPQILIPENIVKLLAVVWL